MRFFCHLLPYIGQNVVILPTLYVHMRRIPSKMIYKENSSISVQLREQHWFRDSLTCLVEALLWVGCLHIAATMTNQHDSRWYIDSVMGFLFGLVLLIIVARFIPNAAYSRTARRNEVVACAMKTALAFCVLVLAILIDALLPLLACFIFCIALTIERLILNSWFIRYCTRPAHCEYAVFLCNEETVWQQQALQQNTYGLKLVRLEEQTSQQLAEYVAGHPETKSVYCASSALQATELEAIAHTCHKQGLVLHILPQPVSTLNQTMQSECRGIVNVLSPAKLPLQSILNRMLKRLTDIVLSLLVLITIFPVFAIIAFICIKRQSRGPVLITRHMCGMNGKTFQCVTFRTRHYEAAPSFLDDVNDPGYFPFGKFLTHSKLELLPQFLCVFMGSMTIVGSQMMHPDRYKDYCRELKQSFASNYRLKAGITSYHLPPQTKGSTKADIWYFRNWGFWLDLRIMLQRIGTLLRKSQAKSIHYI